MACACQKHTAVINTEQVTAILFESPISIADFLTSNGWYRVGSCSCSPPKDIYNHDVLTRQGVVIWANHDRMEIRRFFGDNSRDSRVERLAGQANFQHIYQLYFNG